MAEERSRTPSLDVGASLDAAASSDGLSWEDPAADDKRIKSQEIQARYMGLILVVTGGEGIIDTTARHDDLVSFFIGINRVVDVARRTFKPANLTAVSGNESIATGHFMVEIDAPLSRMQGI